jgi:hypothetical protein
VFPIGLGLFGSATEYVCDFPEPIRHASYHRRPHAPLRMSADEIVIDHVERNGVSVVLDLFRKGVVSRAKRLICIRALKLFLSTFDVPTCARAGLLHINLTPYVK